ncbi:hypothetical protein [Nostoc sp. CHAB 5715]|nr:hypothetical protein [Nostoc sp. CHAB 5715]
MSQSLNFMEINTLAESQTANFKVNILLENREDSSAIAMTY